MKTLQLSWRLSMVLMACIGSIHAQTISISSLSPNYVFCNSPSTISFTKTGTFNAGNSFIVQLSDGAGNFASPRTLASGAASPLSYTGPYVLPGAYKIRIVSTNPVVTSNVIGPYNAGVELGSTFNTAIPAGNIVCGTPYSNTVNNSTSSCYGNDYDASINSSQSQGQPSDDIYYKFTLERTESVDISTCGSGIDTYIHLLDQWGNTILSNDDDISPTFACGGLTSYINCRLSKGTYYVVSEGYGYSSGSITTNISTRPGLYFDGVDDRVTLDNSSTAAYNFGTGPFTIEANIQSAKNGLQTILGKRSSNGAVGFCFGEGGGGKLWMQLAGANYEAPTTPLYNGCRHVAVTRDVTDTLRFYVDGALIWKIKCINNISSPVPAIIGWDPYYAQTYKGYIRDLRVWNIQRTQAELIADRDNYLGGGQAGLVGNYQMRKEFQSPYQYISDFSITGALGYLGTNTTVESSDPSYSCEITCFPDARPGPGAEAEVTGISKEEASGELKVYPNPFIHTTTIVLSGKQETVKLEIVNMNGTVVYKNDAYRTNEELVLGDKFATGFYILRATSNEGTKILKLVKAE